LKDVKVKWTDVGQTLLTWPVVRSRSIMPTGRTAQVYNFCRTSAHKNYTEMKTLL